MRTSAANLHGRKSLLPSHTVRHELERGARELPPEEIIERDVLVHGDDDPEGHLVTAFAHLVPQGALREERGGPSAEKLGSVERRFRRAPATGLRFPFIAPVEQVGDAAGRRPDAGEDGAIQVGADFPKCPDRRGEQRGEKENRRPRNGVAPCREGFG